MKWGTGGINVDGCRISVNEEDAKKTNRLNHKGNFDWSHKDTTAFKMGQGADISQGRWPANTLFDEEAAEMLDDQSGVLVSKFGKQRSKHEGDKSMFGLAVPKDVNKYSGDTGGASRFFYCAKASQKERGENNKHPTVKPIKLMEYLIKLVTPPNGTVLDPFMGSGSTILAAKNLGFDTIGVEKELEYFNIAKKRVAL